MEVQRRKLARQLVRALHCLSQMWLWSGEPALAVETALEAVTLDQFRESSHQILMRSYVSIGNPSEAVMVYHRLLELLSEELGTALPMARRPFTWSCWGDPACRVHIESHSWGLPWN